MKILAFDTSTELCSVALSHDNNVFSRREIAPRKHAELILSMIEAVLAEAGLALSELDALVFGQGPGSFIGVRIAAGVAQAIAFAHHLPVIAVSTLQTIAQATHQKNGERRVLSGWDARMSELYWGGYELDDAEVMQPILLDQLSAPELFNAPGGDWYFAGNAWSIYYPERSSKLIYPEATAMLPIAVAALKAGKTLSALQIEPQYLRNQVAKKPV